MRGEILNKIVGSALQEVMHSGAIGRLGAQCTSLPPQWKAEAPGEPAFGAAFLVIIMLAGRFRPGMSGGTCCARLLRLRATARFSCRCSCGERADGLSGGRGDGPSGEGGSGDFGDLAKA